MLIIHLIYYLYRHFEVGFFVRLSFFRLLLPIFLMLAHIAISI